MLAAAILCITVTTTCAFLPKPRKGHGNDSSLMAWSRRIAEVNEIGSTECRDCSKVAHDGRVFDLESPREWMEYLEATQGQGGAYTVLRCDFQSGKRWKLWGRDFHMRRLLQSYCALAQTNVHEQHLESAIHTTDKILNALLEQASLVRNENDKDATMYVLMLTILWQQGTKAESIVVRGHSCCSGKPIDETRISNPITAVLALDDRELPNRYNRMPEAKLSSWCRRRRSLENVFKVNGAGEVFLTRQVKDKEDIEILEGLTSNVFFLYPDKKLCTADSGVLKGYARKLVLECAQNLGLHHDSTPIRIQDASLWKEIFLTSSVRLVVPVKQLLIPNERGELVTLWSANEFPTCMLLYQELMKDM